MDPLAVQLSGTKQTWNIDQALSIARGIFSSLSELQYVLAFMLMNKQEKSTLLNFIFRFFFIIMF